MKRAGLGQRWLAALLVFGLCATGAWATGEGESGTTMAADRVMVEDPTTGEMVLAPQYGGTLTYPCWGDTPTLDTFKNHDPGVLASGVVEKLSHADWGFDRRQHNFRTTYLPWGLQKPFLAESWNQSSPTTFEIILRDNVYWHDKAPMNGRKFTARDVVFNYHRYFGNGSGFTEPSAYFAGRVPSLQSITAVDDRTVLFNLGEPQLNGIEKVVTNEVGFMFPPEVIQEHGDMSNWEHLVGTGPFQLVDLVPGSSWTYTKNPGYWGRDEKYGNQLPYVDEMQVLVMPEEATRLAALRSGKIDGIGLVFCWTQVGSIDQIQSIQRTDPHLTIEPLGAMSNTSFTVNTQEAPFDDVRVRRALQLALNLDEINEVFFMGYADNVPQTYMGSDFFGFVVPFAEWPSEIQQYYTYDPAKAEALLDEAGLARGTDGKRFRTTLLMRVDEAGVTNDHALIAKEYWEEIGIEVEAEVIDTNIWRERVTKSKDWAGITPWRAAYDWDPLGQMRLIAQLDADRQSPPNLNDPVLNEMVAAVEATTDLEERLRLSREVSLHLAERHYSIWGGEAPQFSVVQPWLIGFNGETYLSHMDSHPILARLWIDAGLKAEKGP